MTAYWTNTYSIQKQDCLFFPCNVTESCDSWKQPTNHTHLNKQTNKNWRHHHYIGALKLFHGAVQTVIAEAIAEILQQLDTEKRIKENVDTLA